MSTNIAYHLSPSRATNVARVQSLVDFKHSSINVIQGKYENHYDMRVLFSLDRLSLATNQTKLVLDISDHICKTPSYFSLKSKIRRQCSLHRLHRRIRKLDAMIVASIDQYKYYSKLNEKVFIRHDKSIYHNYFDENLRISNDVCVFVWDGQAIHFPVLFRLLKCQKRFFTRNDVLLKVVTDKINPLTNQSVINQLENLDINFKFVEWTPSSYISEVKDAFCGLAPLDLSCSHSSAKPNNKLINYQGLGLPVICSASTDYIAFSSKSRGSIFCANSDESWESALLSILNQHKNHRSRDFLGRQYVMHTYDDQYFHNSWERVINEVL